MNVSNDLLILLTRNNNCFIRKNLNRWFTADPFSATNTTRVSDLGVAGNHFTAVNAACGKKAEAGTVVLQKKTFSFKKVKKGGKNTDRSFAHKFTEKVVPAEKATGFGCPLLTARGARLNRAAKRIARLAKGQAVKTA